MSFAIFNPDEEHLGFLLLANEGISGGAITGDCIFRHLPFSEGLSDSIHSRTLHQLHERGELVWHRTADHFEIVDFNNTLIASIDDQTLLTDGVSFTVLTLDACPSF